MISPISNFRENRLVTFKSEPKEKTGADSAYDEDTLLNNNFATRTRIGLDKLTKAFTIYPAKGLKGSINSNFYEFLTLGQNVPFIIGSATLISIFNSVNKHFSHNAAIKAAKLGNKMALGVLLYALAKEASKILVTKPIQMITGIDTELPYAKVNYFLQERPGVYDDLTSIEYHKVGESVDFPRWDLLYGDPKKGEARNFRYDKIAQKNGLGTDLNDSDQDVKPIYKEVLVKSKLAKSFSSFLWAVTAVALAFQKPWDDYFKAATLKVWKGKDFMHSLKVFGRSLVRSAKALYEGPVHSKSPITKHAGKALLGLAAITTVLGVANSVHLTQKPQKHNDVINPKKESVVC